MFKRDITYEDYNGDQVTESAWFHLSKAEIIELEVSYEGGLEAMIKRVIKSDDRQALIAEFKKLVLLSYGKKSDDGRRFIKSDELRTEFSQTAAYDALFIDLATDATAAANFFKGILPKDMAAEVAKLDNETPTPPAPRLPAPSV